MTPRISFPRALVASACALALLFPAGVQARTADPEPDPEAAGGATEELPGPAEEHVVKALQSFRSGDYLSAEASFKRVAFYAPKWRPLHYNMAVLAEAQGNLGTALREYKSFRPYATVDEGLVVDQRIHELDDRRRKIAGMYKRQIAVGSIAVVLGVGMLGGGGALIGSYVSKGKKVDSLEAENTTLNNDPMDSRVMENNTQIDALEEQRKKLLYPSILLITVGLLVVAYSVIPLSRSIKSKRQLDGIALGKSRLQWAGGAGLRLRF